MAGFQDRSWTSADGLKLHYRDYAGPAERPPLLCLPGLTRNARDFAGLADRFAGEWRVICPDLRGRGDSDYAKDSSTYVPEQYVGDVQRLLAELAIEHYVAIGTSLGGLLTIMMAAAAPEGIAGALINDIGPDIEPEGLERIRNYVGQGRSYPTWMHAARALQESQGTSHPGFATSDWLAQAKRLMTLGAGGRIVFDYDMKIADTFAGDRPSPQADLWPLLDSLAGKPVTVLRGETSDLLSAETAARMIARLPGAELVVVPQVGHAPTLDEPEAVAAIERLLARVK